MADKELKIVVTTQADTAGAERAASAMDKVRDRANAAADVDEYGLLEFAGGLDAVNRAAEEADDELVAYARSAGAAAPAVSNTAKAGQDLGRSLGQAAEIGNSATSAVASLSAAAQGGSGSLFALARGGFAAATAAKGLRASIGALGAVAAGIGIAVGVISMALRKSEESAKAAREEIDKLNQQKLDDAVKAQEELKRAADETLRALQAEAAANEQIADAELGKRKAETIAAAKASGEDPLVTQQKLTALDRQREDEKRIAALNLANDEARLAEEHQQKMQEQAAKAAQDLADVDARREEVKAAKAAKAYADAAVGLTSKAGAAVTPEQARAQSEAGKRLAAAEEAAKGDTEEQIKALEQAKKDRQKDAEQAARDADKATADRDRLLRTEQAIAPKTDATRAAEDASTRGQTPEQKAAQEKAVRELRSQWKSQIDEQIARGAYTNEAAYTEVYGAGAWQKVRRMPGVGGPQSPSAPMNPALAQPQAPAAPPSNPNWLNPTSGPIDPRIQRDGGSLPGDGQASKGITRALEDTTKAVESQDTGDDTAKAAEALKAKTEEQAKAQQESGSATVDALTGAADAQQQAADSVVETQRAVVAKLGEVVGAQNSLRAEMRSLAAQVRAQRVV